MVALFFKTKQTARFQVCELVEICQSELGDHSDCSCAEKSGMSSGSRLPKAQADTECLFVYLGEVWPRSHYFIAGSLLKYKDNDMFEKCLKRQLAGIETTPGSCFFMSLLAVLITLQYYT